MFKKMLVAGLVAAALPAVALAQPADPNCLRSNHDTRVEGTVLGAVAGGLIGGALGHGTGAAVGAVGGAVAGNAIAGTQNQPCPPGYYRAPPPPPPPAYGYDRGYDHDHDHGYAPPPAAFWHGAPTDIHERIEFMQARLQDAARSGRLSPPQADRAFDELHRIRDSIRSLAYRDHGLTPDDRAYVQAELDHLGASVHWMERTGY
jgi:hypothetical protein